MTIGIGVLASKDKRPDHVILMADTKGSFGDEYSMNRLHKIFTFPEEHLYVTAAGLIDRASELVTLIDELFKTEKPQGYSSILLVINKALYLYRQQRFGIEIAPTIWMPKEDLVGGNIPPEARQKIEAAWPDFRTGCDVIIGTFGPGGQAYLFAVTEDTLDNQSFPGFTAIGSGAGNAMFWLSYRNHHLAMSIRRAAYHAFEAKVMAESSPFVNDKLDVLIANSTNHFLLTDFKPTPDDAPFTVDDLRTMWSKHMPQSTDDI
jgi:hypothetical protein